MARARALVCATILSVAAVAARAPAGADVRPAGAAVGRPNVLVVLLDDMPALDDRLWRRLPVIRELFLEQGAHFTNAYVETPLCCPGRAGWLTGLHTLNHGVDDNDARLFDPTMTIATQLDGAGYHTLYAGKYFNGYARIARRVPPGWDRFHGFGAGYYAYKVWHDGEKERRGRRPRDYSTDVLRETLLADLRAAPADRPVFVFASFAAPHAPRIAARRHEGDPRCRDLVWAPPNFNEADVSDKPVYVAGRILLTTGPYDLSEQCRMMLSVDEAIGALRDELVAQGRFDDTLVVLTSDNGMNAGAHRLYGKATPYATAVPLLMHWPAGLGPAPRELEHLVSNIDLAPTLCELAGCSLGPYPNGQQGPDGASFAGLLDGVGSVPERDAILEAMPLPWVGPPWYGLRTSAESSWSALGCDTAATSGCRWHYVEYETGERELYDLRGGPCVDWQPGAAGDPCELENLADTGRHDALMAQLSARLAELKAEGNPPRRHRSRMQRFDGGGRTSQ